MKFGYVLCDPKRSKILVLKKNGDVEFLKTNNKENINKSFCLRDISTMKQLYKSLKEKKLVGQMHIVDIQELYGKN
mgnify:FL=1|tara:strand:- start:10 stop:237 length:228 start_codon:yes stop_codon:yes gene_type:complete